MQDSRGKRIVNLILKNSELNGTLHSTPVTPSTVEVNLVVQSENPTFGGEEQAQAVEYPVQMSDLEEPFQSSGANLFLTQQMHQKKVISQKTRLDWGTE
nr:unnamed protein product [Callosobruchus analis]